VQAREGLKQFMYVFFEPMSEEQVETIQSVNASKIKEWEAKILRLPGYEDDAQLAEEKASEKGDLSGEVRPYHYFVATSAHKTRQL